MNTADTFIHALGINKINENLHKPVHNLIKGYHYTGWLLGVTLE